MAGKIDDLSKQLPSGVEAETGIELTKAQRSLDPAQLEIQSFTGRLPEGSRQAAERLGTQNREALASVADVIETISPASDRAATGIRSAANAAIETATEIRKQLTSPAFTKAFNTAANNQIIISDIAENTLERAAKFPEGGKINALLKRTAKLLRNGNLEELHNTKIEIDALINGRGSETIDNFAKRELIGIQKSLIKRLEDTSDLYRDARIAFAEASPQVDDLLEGTVGRVAELNNTQLKNASRIIFDPVEGITNPQVMRDTKKAIIGVEGGQEAWDSIVRSEMERRLGSMRSLPDEIEGIVQNVPAKLKSAIFGNDQSNAALYAAVDPHTARALRFLEEALTRASFGRVVGSPTAAREQIIQGAKPLGRIRKLFKPRDLIDELGTEGAITRVANAAFTRDGADIINEIAVLAEKGDNYALQFEKLQTLLNGLESAQNTARAATSAYITSSAQNR